MKRFSYILLISGLILFISCHSFKKLDGYWICKYGDSNNDTEFILNKFEEENSIFYNSKSTQYRNYYRIFNYLIFPSSDQYHYAFRLKYKIKKKTLTLIRPKADTIIYTFNKPSQTSIAGEIIFQNHIEIKLPQYSDFDQPSNLEFESKHQIFIPFSDSSNIIIYKGQEYIIDSFLFKVFINELFYNQTKHSDYNKIVFSIFADEHIPYSSIQLLFYNLKVANLLKLKFVLDSDGEFDFVNQLFRKLPSLSEIERIEIEKKLEKEKDFKIDSFFSRQPPLRMLYSEEWYLTHMLLFEFSEGKIKIVNDTFSSDIKASLKSKYLSDPEIIIGYHLNNDATYQDYITMNCYIQTIVEELVDEFCLENYGKNSSETTAQEMRFAHKKFPLRLMQLDDENFINIKSNL